MKPNMNLSERQLDAIERSRAMQIQTIEAYVTGGFAVQTPHGTFVKPTRRKRVPRCPWCDHIAHARACAPLRALLWAADPPDDPIEPGPGGNDVPQPGEPIPVEARQ
jgi:hypothetical protein